MDKDAKGGHAAMRMRLTLTWFVGCGVMIVVTFTGTAPLFGGLAVAAIGDRAACHCGLSVPSHET